MLRFAILTSILLSIIFTLPCNAALSGSLNPEKIIERLQPLGRVDVEGASNQPLTVKVITHPGQLIYEKVCHTCHESGLAGAPKFGDKNAWEKRKAQGLELLHTHALKGFKAMPSKGTCTSCSEEDIFKAIDYMLSAVK